jgi:two-component system sensor histidine kinase BaeS
LLVITPIIGIALIYLLETRLLLPVLARELVDEAVLIADLTHDHPSIWADPVAARSFISYSDPYRMARVTLLDVSGRLIASSSADDAARPVEMIADSDLSELSKGKIVERTDYSRGLRSEIVDVLVPATGPNQQVLGIVRLSYPLESAYPYFSTLRLLILGVLVFGLLVGLALGWILAVNIEYPLKRVSQAIQHLTAGDQLYPIAEQGPEEISVLITSFNALVIRLRVLEENRRRLLSNLVHELGRPLGALGSATEALLGGAAEDPQLRQELLTGIKEELRLLERLLDDLAGLRNQIVGPVALKFQHVDLHQWLSPLLSTWQEDARRKGLQWKTEIPSELPTLVIDPDRLYQVIGNLLSNAIKYTPSGGLITVGASVDQTSVNIWVADTGPGIDVDEQSRIFTPLYRGSADTRFPLGMGLGLSIAQDVVVAHGGRLELDSVPGEGSRFTIRLPMETDRPAKPSS